MSTDAEIAVLAREAPHDPLGRYRWRCALVRAGRGAEAGFEEGDEVSVGDGPALVIDDDFGLVALRYTQGPSFLSFGLTHSDQSAWTLLTPAKPKGGGE